MRYILLLLVLFSCSPSSIEIENGTNLLNQKWIEVNYPYNSIIANDSMIIQTGFPLVKGFDIKYTFSDIYYCKFINILGKTDSFTLKILDINNTQLTLQLYNYYFHQNITFIK